MKPCPSCRTENAAGSNFCKRCGVPLDGAGPPPMQATVRWLPEGGHGGAPLREVVPRRAIAVEALFAGRDRLLIGRDRGNDVCLPHPTISRAHASLTREPGGLRLTDLGSVNGVYVNGRRLEEPVLLRDGDQVGIGPFLFSLAGGVVFSVDSSQSLRLEARRLEKAVRLSGGETRKLLCDVSLAVEPGEFVSLLGPSGSGKSTLMDCLNGRRRATGGQVLANGEDFYRHLASFRQSIGYVPQKDIIHTQLSVERALHYTAQLRLPVDTTPDERRARVEAVLGQMDLSAHRGTLVANLSGGQIKRVSLGAELLAQPCLLYIDEATSGLDAGTEARMMRLFRRLADEGKTVFCITHNVENVDACHLALFLIRGRLAFVGPPREAPKYFGVGRLGEVYDRLGEKEPEVWERLFRASDFYKEYVVRRLASPSLTAVETGSGVRVDTQYLPGRLPPASVPELNLQTDTAVIAQPDEPDEPGESDTETGRQGDKKEDDLATVAVSPGSPVPSSVSGLPGGHSAADMLLGGALPKPPRPPFFHQFRVLTLRYLELLRADRRSFQLLLLQAPIVAAFVLVGFAHQPYQRKILAPRPLYEHERGLLRQAGELLPEGEPRDAVMGLAESDAPVVPTRLIVDPTFNYMLMFILSMVVLWFGCNNAAKEIVKEEAVYGRERAINLGIAPYLASKFVVQGALTALQTLALLACVFGVLEVFHLWLGHQTPSREYRLAYPEMLVVLGLLALTGVALGLFLSACVSSPDRANALLPYVLIPQIILAGGIVAVTAEPLHALAVTLSPVYWAFRGVRAGETTLPPDFPGHMDYNDALWIPCVALAVQAAVLLVLAALALRRKDYA